LARQLYSRRFLAHSGLSGTGPSVTVPAGHVYVVKQLTGYIDPSFGILRCYFQDGASGAALFSFGQSPGNPEWFGFYGALVFEAGDSFHWQVTGTIGDSADLYAGGYDLIV
jgi:hypothetical protein